MPQSFPTFELVFDFGISNLVHISTNNFWKRFLELVFHSLQGLKKIIVN